MAGLAAYGVLTNPINGDPAFYIYSAGRMLDGAHLYSDILDSNPPLIYYLSIPPVYVGRLTGLRPETVFGLFLILLGVASLLLCDLVLHRLLDADSLLADLLLSVAAFSFFLLARQHFGQREHMMYIMTLPYWLLAAGSYVDNSKESLALRIPIGLMAGVGLMLKPYFLLPWFGVQLFRLWPAQRRRQMISVDNLIIVGVGALYALLVVFVTPGYFAVARMALPIYDAFNMPLRGIVLDPTFLIFYVLLAACLLFRSSARRKDARIVFLIVTIGFAGSVLLQHKGFGYHYYPMRAAELALAAILVRDLTEQQRVL